VRGKLDFSIEIKTHNKLDSSFSLTGSICTYSDERVGSFFASSHQLYDGDTTIKLSLANHNLSVGSYYLNIAISTGNVMDGNLKMIDHAYNAIGFEILKEKEHGKFLTEWNSNWGKIYFPSTLTVK
jgi:lipopolysaccharide transport system ATP-binding protein